MEKIRIWIADDKELIRNGLKMQLDSEPHIEVIGTASQGKELLEMLEAEVPDIVLMDIAMPVMDGLEATRKLKERNPEVRVIMLTDYDELPLVRKARKIQAEGYILKNVSKEDLISTIEQVYSGKTVFDQNFDSGKAKLPIPKISDREKEILENLSNGLSSQETATKLFISKNTVDTHRKNLLAKSGCRNVAELVRWAMDNGLI